MNLPRLGSATVRAYLARLGDPDVSLDLEGLSRLQQAHLRALPFHNLELLASASSPPRLPPVEAAVEGNLAGLGGSCHQLTPPFVALLGALGFEAWLAAASVHAPGDHCVGVVRLPSGCHVVDVGSGQPTLRPLPLGGEPLDFSAYGEAFRFERVAHEEYQLGRTGPQGRVETVYRLRAAPCAPASFVARGVAPALGSVRAVRMSTWALARLQDALYQRFAGGLASTRPIVSWSALAELLHVTFGLPEALVERALQTVRRHPPGLPAEARPPGRFILSLAVTDRAEGARGLLRSVAEALAKDSRPADSVGVLLLDNGRTGPVVLEEARQRGLRVVQWEARHALGRLAPFQRGGWLPETLSPPLPIGASRTLQACLLHEHLRTNSLDLPHPADGRGPVLVWMLDDDLSFHRLGETPEGFEVQPVGDLFARAEALWAGHPEVSVVLGTFTGEPPIPGYATLHVQVKDLAGNLQALASLEPEAPWRPRAAPRELPDYYYDHARGSEAHLQTVFPWRPPGRAPWSVRQAFQELCEAFTQVPRGQQVTRPLTYRPEPALRPSRDRGGNALFLDPDALVAAPYPVLRGEDGLLSRRADTLWAHLVAREPLVRLVQADLDLLHGRRAGDGSSPLADDEPSPAALRRFVESQERGVVLARLLERSGPLETVDAEREVATRRHLLARGREGVRQEVARARSVLSCPEAWWWRGEETATSARTCLATLAQVETLAGAVEALEDPGLAARLAGFARHLVAAWPAWRATWG